MHALEFPAQWVHSGCTEDLPIFIEKDMEKKITKKAIDAMKPGDILVDTEVRGFVARCLPSRVVTYGLRYRDKTTHKRHWIGLGLHGALTPEQARTKAQAQLGDVAREENPLAKQRALVEKAKGGDTVGNLLDNFVKLYVNGSAKLRSAAEIEGLFERIVKPRIGNRSIYELKRSEIVSMLDQIDAERGPVMADRVLAHIRKAFNWHMARNDNFTSPIVRGMARTRPKDRERDRKLSDEEIRQVWIASESVNATFRGIVRLLLLTGQRRDEIARMKLAWVNVDTLEIPADQYKTKRPHVVPLTRAALEIINSQTSFNGCEYVFSTNGETPYSGFSKSKTLLDVAVNAARAKVAIDNPAGKDSKPDVMPEWRLHDLRRTARSLMSGASVPSDVAELVLGHVVKGIKRVYDRHDYLAEKRDALERLGAAIERIVNPPPANVVELGKAKKSARGGTAQ
jgi:integrase